MLLDGPFENDKARWPLLVSQAYALFSRRAGLLWYVGAVVLGVAWCVITGIDTNYDRLNYHIPSAYTLLQGRLFEDVAISSLQTYFSPVINLLSYTLARELGFFWSRYALVAIHALAWAFLAAAVWRVIVLELKPEPAQALVVGVAMAALSLCAPVSISVLGTTYADLTVAIFISAALLIRLPTGFEARTWRGALTGLVLGIGVGLKPTILPICLAYGIVFYVMLAMLTRPAKAIVEFVAFGVAAAVATLATAGPWQLAVLRETGNPIFPYANEFFRSPFVPPIAMADNRFLPASLADWLSVPARLAIGGENISGEARIRDIRFALFWYALVPAIVVLAAWRWRQFAAFCRSAPRTVFLYVFFIAAYVAWEATTGIHRYALTLDHLVGFLLVLPLLLVPFRWACIAAGTVAVAHMASMRPPIWDRDLVAYDQSPAPGAGKTVAEDALVFNSRLSLLDSPKGYLVDYFGPASRFVMHSGFELGLALDTSANGPFADKIRALLGRRWRDGIWYVSDVAPDARAQTYLSGYGLRLTSDCKPVTTWAARQLVMCRVSQATTP
jgi:hypothetical protein